MSNIDKIRQEIERRIQRENEILWNAKKRGTYPSPSCEYNLLTLTSLRDFIDTLSEEPDKSLEEAAEKYQSDARRHVLDNTPIGTAKDAFIAGAEWAFRQGWTFDAHKGAFGICFDRNIDNLLDSLKDKEEVTVQIRKK